MMDAQPLETRPPALDSWLEIATQRLSDSARQRVQEDIEEHFREAVEAGQTADAAMNGLGDPRVAGRKFRRSHLTRFDERLVQDICRKPPRFMFWIFLGVFGFTFLTFAGIFGPRLAHAPAAAVLLTMVGAMLAVFGIAPALARRGRVRAATATGPLGYWIFFTAANVGGSLLRGNQQPVQVTIHAAAFIVLTALYIPLWIKLRNRERYVA